jgi:pyridoxine 5-phosphate synthase
MIQLGVNVDHVATIRQARMTDEPDPVAAAALAAAGGADAIVIHLREDRRHIQDHDLTTLLDTTELPVNLEMGLSEEIIGIALDVAPARVTLVPERREEITTEGGLNVTGEIDRITAAIRKFHEQNVEVSLFIDPVREQIEASVNTGADAIELHTGAFANAADSTTRDREIAALTDAAALARSLNLFVACGHGLTYRNVEPIARMVDIAEYNIGHSIISHSVFVGIEQAVREMKTLLIECRSAALA